MDKKTEKKISELEEESVPKKTKIAFGLFGTGHSALNGIALGSAITFFYNVKLGLGEDLVSLAWIIFGIWNAINDPLFGIFQERTHSKLGRRIPYLRYGAPLYALTFIFCWFPVFENSQWAKFWNLLLVLFLFDSMFTIIGLITYTLPAEMAITQKERSSIVMYSTYFSAIGILISMVLPMILLTDDNPDKLNPWFQPAMIILGISASILMYFSTFHIYENKYAMFEEPLGFFESIKETVKNREFLVFESFNFPLQIAWTILNGTITYYVQYILKLTGFASSIPLVAVFASIFAFTIFANKMVAKYGVKRSLKYGLLACSINYVIFFLIGDGVVGGIIGLSLVGVPFAITTLTSNLAMTDVIDYDETLTGKRRETTYAGVNALFVKPSISIANALFLTIIKAFGFNKDQSVQTARAEFGILFAFTVVPAICVFLGYLAIRRFKLEGEEWKETKEKLHRIHQEKEKKIIAEAQKGERIQVEIPEEELEKLRFEEEDADLYVDDSENHT